jgi:hypothetical protein
MTFELVRYDAARKVIAAARRVQDAAHVDFALCAMEGIAERAIWSESTQP